MNLLLKEFFWVNNTAPYLLFCAKQFAMLALLLCFAVTMSVDEITGTRCLWGLFLFD